MKYVFEMSIDVGKAIPEVASLVSDVNRFMSSEGFDEHLSVMAGVVNMTLESSRPLTKWEEQCIMRLLTEQFQEKFPELGFRCTNVCRQPGNVPQSAS